MPRQQSGGITRGGGMDPFVAAASQQRSAQGHDMRKAAMQEQQATKRQGMANDTSVAKTNYEAAAAKQMQSEAAAEREIARRQDNDFATEQKTKDHEFWNERENSTREWEKSLQEGNIEEAERWRIDDDIALAEQSAQVMAGMRDNRNMILNLGKQAQREAEVEQKLTTENLQYNKDLEARITMHGQAKTAFTSAAAVGNMFKYDAAYEGAPDLEIGLDKNFPKGYSLVSKLPGTKDLNKLIDKATSIEKGRRVDAIAAVNSQKVAKGFDSYLKLSSSNLSDVTANTLNTKDGIDSIALQMYNGAIKAKDIAVLDASLAGMVDHMTQQESEGETPEARQFYAAEKNKWALKKANLRKLINVKDLKMPGEGVQETIGAAANRELSLVSESPDDRELRRTAAMNMATGGKDAVLESLKNNIPGQFEDRDLPQRYRVGGAGRGAYDEYMNRRTTRKQGSQRATLGEGRIILPE